MERRLRGRNPNRKYDFFYIGIGLVISIMAIFALTKPEENQVLFPFIFFLERELAKWQEMGMSREEIREYVQYFTGAFAVIGLVSAIVFGIAGVYIGKLILKRHFKDVD